MKLRWWLSDRLEEMMTFKTKVWLCTIKGKHHEKMQSYGHCYRCGKVLSP